MHEEFVFRIPHSMLEFRIRSEGSMDGLVYVSGSFRSGGPGERQRLRSRPALRRRRVRRHSRLQRPRVQARTPHRPAVRLRQGDPARDPALARATSAPSSLDDLPRRTAITDGYIRLVVTRGPGDLGLDPRSCAARRSRSSSSSRRWRSTRRPRPGFDVVTSTFRRNVAGGAQPVDQVAELPEQRAGADRGERPRRRRGADARRDGYVAEATVDNFFSSPSTAW